MPQVNLSTLNDQELRQRLDWSRARGDAAVAYQILQEMAVRREAAAPKRGWTKRKAAEPRIVEVEMGDPLERTDDVPPMPNWRPPSAAPVEAAPIPAVAPIEVEAPPSPPVAPEPLNLRLVDPEPAAAEATGAEDLDLRLAPEVLEGRQPRARPRPAPGARIAAGFAVGILSGLGLGWWAAGMTRDAAPPAAPVQMASLIRAPEPAPAILDVTVADPAAALEAVPEPPPPPELAEEDAPATETAPLEQEPVVEMAEALQAVPHQVVATKPAAVGACAAEPTPADREICSDPALQRLQRELRQAYSKALEAHEERGLLRQRQLAWREARNTVTDPGRLARLYEQRINKLYAATAEARAAQR